MSGGVHKSSVSLGDGSLIANHMPELDVFRGVAVLMVLHCHMFTAYSKGSLWTLDTGSAVSAVLRAAVSIASPLGWLGVQLFFVLSGFLITGILIDTRTQPRFYSKFYARRTVRILPAYILCLLSLVLLGWTSWGFPAWRVGQVICCLSFAANLTPLFGMPLLYGPLWSLAVEEHFYMLWPMVVKNCHRRLGAICVTVVVAEIGLRWLARSEVPAEEILTLTWFNLDGLAIGAFTGLMLRRNHNAPRRVATYAHLNGVIAVGSLVGLQSLGQLLRATFGGIVFGPTAWSLLFAMCILLAVIARSRRPSLWVAPWPFGIFRWFGFISYGLYLIHMMVMQLADHFLSGLVYPADFASHRLRDVVVRYAVIAVSASALAFLSRITYEQFFLSRKAAAEAVFFRWFGRHGAING